MISLSQLPQTIGKVIPREFLYWLVEALNRINNKLDLLTSGTVGNVVQIETGGEIGDTGKAAPAGAFVGTTDTQTLTNKTLTLPTIADFTNANHDHADAAAGGLIDLNQVYPVGIEILTDGTTPAVLGFPGTWEEQ